MAGVHRASEWRKFVTRAGRALSFATLEFGAAPLGDPWGLGSPLQDLIAGGDPLVRPLAGQYAPGGVLRHPARTSAACETHTGTPDAHTDEYGFLYGANIIEQWIRPAGTGVDVIWNASTWNPYRVILLRTRIDP